MSYEAIAQRGDVARGISILDLSSSTGGENRLYEIMIEKPEQILSHSVTEPEPIPPNGNIVNNGMAFPDLPFPMGTFHMVPNPNDPNPEPKANIENAITKMLNNSWLMIIGGSLILMIIICAFALIYYFKNQKKSSSQVVYKFNS